MTSADTVRQATFAGSWYPADPQACEQQIQAFLQEPGLTDPPPGDYTGGIVPHAGWYFSGAIACRVIHALKAAEPPDAVVVFGMHLPPGASPHVMTRGAWETPFGPLAVHTGLVEALTGRFGFVTETPRRFTRDNTIELQLPFVRYFLGDVPVVTIGAPPEPLSIELGRALAAAAREQGLGVKVIGSTDLTHYGPNYGFAPKGRGTEALAWVREENDRRFIDAVLALDPDAVLREGRTHHNACCSGAVAAALATARELGAAGAHTVGYATSYERHADDSFVGYVGVVF